MLAAPGLASFVEKQFFAMELWWACHGKKRRPTPDCALRKKAALFRDTNCVVVAEVVLWGISAKITPGWSACMCIDMSNVDVDVEWQCEMVYRV
jgi:hypothetical protein